MPDSQNEYIECDRLVKDPLVSVVMITYNHERYLAEAIEGVIRQEADFPVELLIGEDCSTDGTREVALSYQKRFPEMIRVITSEHNVGAHSNVARLIEAARGKYIAFCEGDDFWHRADKLRQQIDCFRGDESVVSVSSGYRTVSAEGEVIDGLQRVNCDVKGIGVEYIDYKDLVLGTSLTPQTLTVVARTWAVAQALTGNSLCNDHTLLIGDLPLWLELSQLGRMIHLPEALASYRWHNNSVNRRSDPVWSLHILLSGFEVKYRALERYPLPGADTQTSQAKILCARRLLLGAARVGDRATARCQWGRLIGLGVRPTLSDVARMAIAFTPLPRRSLTVGARRLTRYLKMHGYKPGGVLGYLLSQFGGLSFSLK